MTQEETRNFVDCMTFENCNVQWRGRVYWCIGVSHDFNRGECSIEVWEADPKTYDYTKNLLKFTGRSTEECMGHFLEDRYWDGKSFYEVAPEMEWIDL